MKLNYIISYIISLFFFFLMLFSVGKMMGEVTNYVIEFHNMDLSYNMCLISNDIKIQEQENSINNNFRSWRDRYGLNESVTYEETYIIGNQQMLKHFLFFGFWSMTFGYTFSYILTVFFMMMDKKTSKKR